MTASDFPKYDPIDWVRSARVALPASLLLDLRFMTKAGVGGAQRRRQSARANQRNLLRKIETRQELWKASARRVSGIALLGPKKLLPHISRRAARPLTGCAQFRLRMSVANRNWMLMKADCRSSASRPARISGETVTTLTLMSLVQA
jgi:hypothetical protein